MGSPLIPYLWTWILEPDVWLVNHRRRTAASESQVAPPNEINKYHPFQNSGTSFYIQDQVSFESFVLQLTKLRLHPQFRSQNWPFVQKQVVPVPVLFCFESTQLRQHKSFCTAVLLNTHTRISHCSRPVHRQF